MDSVQNSRVVTLAGGGDALAILLGQVAHGDRKAFEELYRRTSAKLFGVCLRILPARSQAEEALQEAYLTIWQRAGAFEASRGAPMTWLIALTRNKAVDRLRATRTVAPLPADHAETIPDDAPNAEDTLVASGEEIRLDHCLGTLANDDAGFIRDAFLRGTTYPELATEAGLPLGTVKSRIRRALLKLRDCLR